MRPSPQFEIYNYIYQKCLELGFNTYDHLPLRNEKVDYPFVVVGEQDSTVKTYKDVNSGVIYTTVSIWGIRTQRTQIDEMMKQISDLTNLFFITKNYRFTGRPGLLTYNLLADDSVEDTIFWHGVVTLPFEIS